ncbi:MAG: DUF2085 domain-containing protein [candidate division Zixibacteria bacterium]|nr:DUF2085 domain-containing protein [candidate division Zixibacteria bacterium]
MLKEMKNRSFGYLVNRKWFFLFSAGYTIFIGLPFLAPVLMQLDFPKAAGAIYSIYQFLCHQFPQRSFFLFGDKLMYSLQEIQSAWQVTVNPLILRKFIGSPQMGWKVAWSDRMISMYTSILFVSWIWYPLRKKIKPPPFWAFALFLLPMAIDGFTHMISDFSGIGQGFRDSNLWLAQLTGFKYSAAFYAGDALGSFNSWMRFMTGIIFGIGVVLYGFPYIAEIFETNAENFEAREDKLTLLKEKAIRDIQDFRDQKSLERNN